MPPYASPALRWFRALVIASVALATGVVAHVSADGLLPSPRGLVALAGLVTAFTALFLGRRASTLRVVTLVVTGQGLIHSGLAAMAGHRGDPTATPVAHPTTAPIGAGPRTGTYFDQWAQAHPTGTSAPAVPAWMVHTATDLLAHPGMAAAHVLAAAAVGLWLAVGERALWGVLACTAGLVVPAPLALPPIPSVAPVSTAHRSARIPRTLQHSPGVSRRGPPFVLAA